VANPEHLAKLKEGKASWDEWREDQYKSRDSSADSTIPQEPDLREAYLNGDNLNHVDLRFVDLSGADLSGANLFCTQLSHAKLNRANLSGANLLFADLNGADFSDANLSGANLSQLNRYGSWPAPIKLRGAILRNANLSDSTLATIDLSGLDLRDADLRRTNLIRANLEGADLRGTDLSTALLNGANLAYADLNGAILNHADLTGANLRGSDLRDANLKGSTLCDATLSGANMKGAILIGANLRRAFLTGSSLNEANLAETNLREANLFEANLGGAILRYASLNKAVLTDCRLWDTSRAGWQIKDIICKRAYWDENGGIPTVYASGEFERLYSEQAIIELFYKDGISTFELNTLPALLQHLASKHPDAEIRLKTVEQTAGGAKITISLGEADDSLKKQIEADAMQVVHAQLQLRDNEVFRLQIENETLRQMHENAIRLMLTAGAPHITFNAPVHTAALPSGNARVELHQTFNDSTELIQLIDKLLTRNAELTAPQSAELETTKPRQIHPE